MSKAVITIIDGKHGKITMTTNFTPALKKDESGTPAQRAAVVALESIIKLGRESRRHG